MNMNMEGIEKGLFIVRCPTCGTEFYTNRKFNMFCSDWCFMQWYDKGVEDTKRRDKEDEDG